MVAKINFLKRPSCKVRYTENDGYEMENLISSLEKKKKDPNVVSLLKKISQLDLEISEKNDRFEVIKKERSLAQEEMCNVINDMDVSPVHSKNSQIFLHLCSFEKAESEKDNKDDDVNNKSSDDQRTKKQKKIEKSDRNFVTKNIKLAKERSMAQFSLTDEEKVKLESLLSDIDSEEYSVEQMRQEIPNADVKLMQKNTKGENANKSTSDEKEDGPINYFKLEKKEICTIEDLDVQLHEILKSYNEGGKANQAALTTKDSEDLLQTADNEGRYWKHHQLQKRLEAIEKDLANIAVKDDEERKRIEKGNQQRIEDNEKPDKEKEDDFEEKE